MFSQAANVNFYIIMGADIGFFVLAHFFAYLLRFEFSLNSVQFSNFFSVLPWIVAIKTIVFFGFGLYRGMWRYSSVADMWRLFKAVVFSGLVIIFIILFIHHFKGYSRAVFILDPVATFLFCGGLRMAIRSSFQKYYTINTEGAKRIPRRRRAGRRVIIIGAGDAGEKTLRELWDNSDLDMDPVGFVDDSPSKHGRAIHGIPVLGNVDDLPKLAIRHAINDILIAIPSATGTQMRRIVKLCKQTNVSFQTLPGLGELINGKVSVKDLRDVNYEDLLGRQPVQVKMPEIEGYLNDRCVLVTGAGGSIGSELCRQILRFDPGKIILFDSSEANLYRIQMELKHWIRCRHHIQVLGDVCSRKLLDQIFSAYKPQVVFHAAAYKHVPMLQRNPWQAVLNNVYGTQSVIEASLKHRVDNFVLVSTDKAVRSTNVMGASKRLCELLVEAYQGNGCRMMSVRFGNVVGSSGSVIPLFREQIAKGGPVTITHPEVTRFFMTIPEASQLILQACALGEGGEVFILDMGTPVKIVNLARDLIRLSGKEPDQDIEIVYTGLRPGEKLYEELITKGEGIVPTPHEKILVLKSDGAPNRPRDVDAYKQWLLTGVERLYGVAREYDSCGIRNTLIELVPDYTPQDMEACVLPVR